MKTPEEIKSIFAALKENYKKIATKEFNDCMKYLFDKYGDNLKSIAFPCYQMYFNDGDSTYYSVYNDEPEINGFSCYDDNENNPYRNKNCESMITEIIGFLQSFDDDIYKDLFGDHIKLIITKDGCETIHYEHD